MTLIRHVTSYADLAQLEPLAEDVEATPECAAELRQTLVRVGEKRVAQVREAQRVQAFNQFVGRYHAWLSVLTAERVLKDLGHSSDPNASASAALRDYQENLSDRAWLRLTEVPVEVFRRGEADAFVAEDAGGLSGVDRCTVRVGNPLIQAGRSRAERALRSFKVSRSSVTLAHLLEYLRAEEQALAREVLTL